jgi:GT2 family glycosyltransferase
MLRTGKMEIAVLTACYNRKQKTISFLDSLVNQSIFKKLSIDTYLLDDRSTDGTAEAVKAKFPFVNIKTGTGNLFWAGSMRTIWEYARAQKPYDLFFLFNDDVTLFDKAIENLIAIHQQTGENSAILIGATLDEKTQVASYAGFKLIRENHSFGNFVFPDKYVSVPCDLGNANIMLVDATTVQKIGIFHERYIHGLADFDYTVRAYRAGIDVLIAPGYYGYCEDDHGVNWMSANKSLKERIKYLYSPKGLAYKEYLFYIKKNFPADYFSAFIKLWMKTLFPFFWDKFKKRGIES